MRTITSSASQLHREFHLFAPSVRVSNGLAWASILGAVLVAVAITGAANRNPIAPAEDGAPLARPVRIVEPASTAVWRPGEERIIAWDFRPPNDAAAVAVPRVLYRVRIAAYPASACAPRGTGGFRCDPLHRQALLDDGYVQASAGQFAWTVPAEWDGAPLAEGAYVLELMLVSQDGIPFAVDRKAFTISSEL